MLRKLDNQVRSSWPSGLSTIKLDYLSRAGDELQHVQYGKKTQYRHQNQQQQHQQQQQQKQQQQQNNNTDNNNNGTVQYLTTVQNSTVLYSTVQYLCLI
jgi:hypothetical protein